MAEDTRQMIKPDTWLAGHRAALTVLVDIGPLDSPGTRASPLANEAGAQRLLAMLADLDITPTIIFDPGAQNPFPISQGAGYDPAARIVQTDDLEAANSLSQDRLGTAVTGAVLLGDLRTDALETHDLWFMDGTGSPFPQRTARNRVIIPYTPWWHDITWWSTTQPTPPSAMLEAWSVSLASVRSRGELMTVILSAGVAGMPGLVETVQRFLDEAIGAGDVWITTARDLTRYVLSNIDG
jgi:hypothetical protein